jgi:protein-S-isoprenylcysteine O-methyltransferase Ste14
MLKPNTNETSQIQRRESSPFNAVGVDVIVREQGTPLWRRLLASALVAIAAVIGIAAAALYVYLLWSDPPDMERVRGTVVLVFVLPLAILCGPIWLANWVAVRIDPSRRSKGADKPADKS